MKRIFFTGYILLVIVIIATLWGTDILMNRITKMPSSDSAEFEFAGSIMDHFIKELERYPDEKQNEYIDNLRKSFGGRVFLEPIKDVARVTIDIEGGYPVIKETTEGYYVSQQIPGRELAIVFGPFGDTGYYELLELFYVVIACLILTFPAFVWTVMLWRDLKKIQSATDAFGDGDFTARATVSPVSSLKHLTSAINSMAERVGNLIRSHKDLTNAVSHELRTPVSRIKFGLEMMKQTPEKEAFDRHLDGIGRDICEIESLIDEMLTYAKFDREPEIPELGQFELVSWLSMVVDKEKNACSGRTVEFLSDPELKSYITRFDPKYLEWAVRNLIRNGCAYSDTLVKISLETGDTWCRIHVDDDGQGIPDVDRCRVFEPFARMDSSRTRDTGGYGLGLSIVKRIALWHGGNATISDSELGGARFTIQWPYSENEKP